MKLEYRELDEGVRLLKLSGAMDLNGVSGIEMEFIRYCTGDNMRVLVDLSRVTYLSSIGLPLLVNAAKALAKRHGRMALLSPRPPVMDVLETTGLNRVIPVFKNITSAKAALLAAS